MHKHKIKEYPLALIYQENRITQDKIGMIIPAIKVL
jgi:hypothetical protein